jgi:hypothetical protein
LSCVISAVYADIQVDGGGGVNSGVELTEDDV